MSRLSSVARTPRPTLYWWVRGKSIAAVTGAFVVLFPQTLIRCLWLLGLTVIHRLDLAGEQIDSTATRARRRSARTASRRLTGRRPKTSRSGCGQAGTRL